MLIPEAGERFSVVVVKGENAPAVPPSRSSLERVLHFFRRRAAVTLYRVAAERAGSTPPSKRQPDKQLLDAGELGWLAEQLAEVSKGRCCTLVLHEGLSRAQVEALDEPRRGHLVAGDLPFFLLSVEAFVSSGRGFFAEDKATPFEGDRLEMVQRGVGRGKAPLLLEGETGTGKTRLARLIHHEVLCRSGPFLHLNCASLDEARFDVLFRGVEKGVYTGVVAADSLFVAMDGGTVLLDEFQDLGLRQQAMLLDLLDSFSNRVSGIKVGPTASRWHADVNVIVALNRPLSELLQQQRLRPDLFHRLFRRMRLPTLREHVARGGPKAAAYLRHKLIRLQEVSGVLRLFDEQASDVDIVRQLCRGLSLVELEPGGDLVPIPNAIQPTSLEIPGELLAYGWPGNFRELESLAHLLLDSGCIARWRPDEISERFTTLTAGGSFAATDRSQQAPANPRQLMGRAYLEAAAAAQGSHTRLAEALGLDVRTMRKYVSSWLDRRGDCPYLGAFLSSLDASDQKRFAALIEALLRSPSTRRPAPNG